MTNFGIQKAKQLKQKKEEGNVAFKSGKLEDAYRLYSDALQIDPCNKHTNAKLFFNRATVAAKVNYKIGSLFVTSTIAYTYIIR